MTAQPKPTAADVLLSHPYRPRVTDCGNSRCHTNGQTPAQHAQHQADMLAAAGLLATAEPVVIEVHHHDIEKHAESFNEGYETAVAQGLADDPTLAADWLAEHDAQVAARALRQWADDVDQAYPTDVFRPVAPTWLAQVHAFCQQHGRTLDAISAHVMRNATRTARQDADRIAGGST